MGSAIQRLAGKERIKILFLRPPHHYWPIVNPQDNYLIPLNYPTLAGWLRAKMDFVDIEILDCCCEEVGYKSLEGEFLRRKPDIVAIGTKVVYAHDAMRAFGIAKKMLPDCVTVAGGQIFTHEPEWALNECADIDYVIRYEGERALEHFIRTARDGGTESDCLSLCYRGEGEDAGKMLTTKLAPAVEDLDEIPTPAFDLMPIHKYSPFGKLWPQAAPIQRGRGCVDTCDFCSWIAMEFKHEEDSSGKIKHKPWYRSKSVAKMVKEVDTLVYTFGFKYLFWVDATWNVDDDWLKEFCTEIKKKDYEIGWWSFIRYDAIPRQHANGTLKLMVEAGLRHVLVGVERDDDASLRELNKNVYTASKAKEAFGILREHYPEVFRQATFITGLRSDTEESIKSILDLAIDLDLDFAAFHTLTPFPGTPFYDRMKNAGYLEVTDFSKYDMFYPVMSTETLSREEVADITAWCQAEFVRRRPLKYLRRMFSRQPIRRSLHRWFFFRINEVMFKQVWDAVRGKQTFRGMAGVNTLWKPKWYDE